MKFVYHFTQVFRFFKEKGRYPLANFQKFSNISYARWNLKAILAILALLFIPTTRTFPVKICNFITYDWADLWFTDPRYNENDFTKFSETLQPCQKALLSLNNHWKKKPSVLDMPNSNQGAERAPWLR